MSTLSQFFGAGGAGGCCPLIPIVATCLWCPPIGGSVIMHAIGGGLGSCTPVTDNPRGGAAGGYSHKCITVATGQCYCIVVGGVGTHSCICNVSGATIAICAQGACLCSTQTGCPDCYPGCGIGGDVNYTGGCGGCYCQGSTKVFVSTGGSVGIFCAGLNGSFCNSCNCPTNIVYPVMTVNGIRLDLEYEHYGARPYFPYLKNLCWGNGCIINLNKIYTGDQAVDPRTVEFIGGPGRNAVTCDSCSGQGFNTSGGLFMGGGGLSRCSGSAQAATCPGRGGCGGGGAAAANILAAGGKGIVFIEYTSL